MRTSAIRRGVSLALVVAIGACGLGAASEDGVVVRDSAGIEIVESSTPRWRAGEEWRLGDTPAVTIGSVFGDEPATQFTRVTGVTRLADGRIVVADEQSAELRYFDASGVHLRSVGGEGSGPGEFASLMGLLRLPGDSLLGTQLMMPKQHLFAADGEFVRTVAMPPAPGSARPSIASAILDDGTVVLSPGFRAIPPFSGLKADSTTLHMVAPGEDSARELGTFPARTFSGNGTVLAPVAFAPTAVYAARGDRIYVRESDRFEIGAYSSDGRQRLIIRRAWTPTPVTQDARDSFSEDFLRDAPEPVRQQYLDVLAFAETFAAYDDMLVDATGHLWVRNGPTDGSTRLNGLAVHPARWSVFDGAGAWNGDLTMPPGFDLVEVGEDYVLGVWYDESEIPFVRLYELIKP